MKELATQLWNWLYMKDQPSKSDIIFLCGGTVLVIPLKGLELYNAGYAPHIVTAGKKGAYENSKTPKPRAEIYYEYLVQQGVSGNDILVQNRSINTVEDVVFSMSLIEKHEIPHKKIMIVTRPFHQRRAYATFKKQFPEIELVNVPADEMSPAELDDVNVRMVALRCVNEFDRIMYYIVKGDIELQIVPPEINDCVSELKKLLTK